MKKLLSLFVLILLIFTLIACNASVPPASCWADIEKLEYTVKDNGEEAGTLVSEIRRNLKEEDKIINDESYPSATTKLSISYIHHNKTLLIESLLSDFIPLATYKKVTTEDNNYELNSYYSGKYYHYSLLKDEEKHIGKIKIKAPYIDNDLLYTYIRTQTLHNLNSTLNIPIASSNRVQKINVSTVGTEKIRVPFPDKEEMVDCHKIAIGRTSSPIGKAIYIYYTPDKEKYTISGSLISMYDSSKIPVRIEENNMVYTLNKISVL